MNINISIVFCQSLISNYYICFNLQQGILAASSLASFLVSSLVGFLASSLASFSVSSLASFLVSSSVSLGYRYSFTTIVLKSVGLLNNYILHISLLILSNLNRLIHLPLCLVLPSYYMSMSKLRGRLQIIITDKLFYQFYQLHKITHQ